MFRIAIAVAITFGVFLPLGSACAEQDYYECLLPQGYTEYSIYPCESEQLQTQVGDKKAPRTESRKKSSPAPAAVTVPPEPKPAITGKNTGESTDKTTGKSAGKSPQDYSLASYKCVGKSGNILYTDARDYLAFETHRCKQISLSDACAELQVLKARDPLAIVSSKLNCP